MLLRPSPVFVVGLLLAQWSAAYSADDKFRTMTGDEEDDWLVAQKKIIDPKSFGLNPALSVTDKAYYDTVGIQWSSYPTRAQLHNLPRDWALTHEELPLPSYTQSETVMFPR